ncbi:hypothetical protein MYCSP_03530 [Mycobacteroides saopaulense]|uniref:hypothetical protein n=1 Tax=Mycobacteroides saopaulense TaxID=1578165 RepID=UPI00071F59A3|nr:hypothetical protein [Mycobacteroides saopaulense]ALR10685.1 hypothetical protein MYCSP_03530 [Mycobacteroides saopaulense]
MLIGAIALLAIFAVWNGWEWVTDGPGHRKPAPPPASFTQRASLPSCGTHIHFRESLPAAQRDCMNHGRASGAGGELTVVQPTIEGDPITTYYRVFSPDQRVEVFVDSSADRFGNFGWSHFFCWSAPLNYPPDPSCDSPADQRDR